MNQAATAEATRNLDYHSAQESDLWPLRDEDPRVREELVSRYLPFARRLASKYRNRWESSDDLIQVASLGLLNAVNRFDPQNGSAFPAFASPTIHGELKRYFRDRVWMIRVPRDIQEEILEVDHAVDTLSADLHRPPPPRKSMTGPASVKAPPAVRPPPSWIGSLLLWTRPWMTARP